MTTEKEQKEQKEQMPATLMEWIPKYICTKLAFPEEDKHTYAAINSLYSLMKTGDGMFKKDELIPIQEEFLRLAKLPIGEYLNVITSSTPFKEEELHEDIQEFCETEFSVGVEEVCNSPLTGRNLLAFFGTMDELAYKLHTLLRAS